jgi:hypothetical protein
MGSLEYRKRINQISSFVSKDYSYEASPIHRQAIHSNLDSLKQYYSSKIVGSRSKGEIKSQSRIDLDRINGESLVQQ